MVGLMAIVIRRQVIQPRRSTRHQQKMKYQESQGVEDCKAHLHHQVQLQLQVLRLAAHLAAGAT